MYVTDNNKKKGAGGNNKKNSGWKVGSLEKMAWRIVDDGYRLKSQLLHNEKQCILLVTTKKRGKTTKKKAGEKWAHFEKWCAHLEISGGREELWMMVIG